VLDAEAGVVIQAGLGLDLAGQRLLVVQQFGAANRLADLLEGVVLLFGCLCRGVAAAAGHSQKSEGGSRGG
jgi:hypothetical protein